jgi:hypothetical protein
MEAARQKVRPVNRIQHELNVGFNRIAFPAMWSLAGVVRGSKRTYRCGPQEIT